MEIKKCAIEGLIEILPQIFGDERGFFTEIWQKKKYETVGIDLPFVQDNHSFSQKGILRGLHFQKKHPQGKLVSVITGEVFDVAIDLRAGSKTFGKWHGVVLTAAKCNQFWIPPGFAHGFCVMSDSAHFIYKCTDYYHPDDEGSIRWDDPTLSIKWPINRPILSKKDREAPYFMDWKELNE